MYRIINDWAKKKVLLERSLNYIYENLRDFWIWEEKGKVVGACALHVVGWQNMAEVKSLAVDKKHQRKGIGGALVRACLDEAKSLGIKRVFALTFSPRFFKKRGFRTFDRNKLPHKIWSDCVNCVDFPNCEEIAVMIDLTKAKY